MRTFILGTDWGSDCDDVVAVRILTRAVHAGKIRLAGVIINHVMTDSAASLDGFLHREGLKDVPIGIDKKARDLTERVSYQKRLAQYAVRYKSNEDAEDGVKLYRRLLAQAEDKVEIAEIGFLHVVADLLESEADEISPLTGRELVRDKVARIWSMAGKWDEDGGREYNIFCTPCTRAGAYAFVESCPVPVTFLGFEIGADVISGRGLAKDDLLYAAMCDHGSPNGRLSWDPMLADLAVTGDAEVAGYTAVQGTARIDRETGANHFTEDAAGLHSYVVRKYDPAWYEARLERAILSE
ncbi:MAG: hypothetical protein IJZ08_02945 [Clostridia bacterium]|nr:hypothetical protein [Clostridia bacterium]